MAKKTPEDIALRPLPAAKTLGERVRLAYIRAGYNRSEFARALDRSLPAIIAWEKVGTDHPDAVQGIKSGDLQAIADLCQVPISWLTTGQLANIAEARVEYLSSGPPDPPYPAWKDFLATPQGKSITDDERYALASSRLRSGRPTVAFYQGQLALLRSGFTVEEIAAGNEQTEAGRRELEEAGGRIVDKAAAKKRRPTRG